MKGLESVAASKLSDSVEWEVVVDNNSRSTSLLSELIRNGARSWKSRPSSVSVPIELQSYERPN
jgi:hypothetical protein